MSDTITVPRALLEQALQALENSSPDQYPEGAGVFYAAMDALYAALESALEQPKQCMAHGECFGGQCIYPSRSVCAEPEKQPDVPETNCGNMESVPFAFYWPPTNTLRRNPLYQLECRPTTAWKAEVPLYTHPQRRALEQQEQWPEVPDCGEAGHAEGCCGNRECLPSFRRTKAALEQSERESTDPIEVRLEFTDSARSALLWVLWHHQGGSSPVGQPLRFALGMGAHDRLSDHQIDEAKRWAARCGSTTQDFHRALEQQEPTGKNYLQVEQPKPKPEPEPVAHCRVRPLQGNESTPTAVVDWVGGRPIPGPLYKVPPPCSTCEALARAVMLDQTGRD